MGWEFAAVWVDESAAWTWAWRRVADDSGALLQQSNAFTRLEECVEDARRNGFEHADHDPMT